MTPKTPNSCTNLNKALIRLAGDDETYLDIRSMMANVIVGQCLPGGVVKGGSQLKLRYGRKQCRYTMDFDTVRNCELDMFLSELRTRLTVGWDEFTADMYVRPQASPKGVAFEYVMQPVDVKLKYKGQSWCTVLLEIGHNELGFADESDIVPLPEEVTSAFIALGFPVPKPIPLMPLKYQVAQKLHGLSARNSDRVRDLIDLQLIINAGEIDLSDVREVCERLFKYRRCQLWPPKVVEAGGWDEIYLNQKLDLPVLPTVDEAIKWANNLIAKIDEAK